MTYCVAFHHNYIITRSRETYGWLLHKMSSILITYLQDQKEETDHHGNSVTQTLSSEFVGCCGRCISTAATLVVQVLLLNYGTPQAQLPETNIIWEAGRGCVLSTFNPAVRPSLDETHITNEKPPSVPSFHFTKLLHFICRIAGPGPPILPPHDCVI